MNKKRLLDLADFMEKRGFKTLGFNMDFFRMEATPENEVRDRSGHSCGTVACIAGWCYVKEKGLDTFMSAVFTDNFELFAQDHLDLGSGEARRLFYNRGSEKNAEDIPLEDAVTVLRNLVETGKVDWNIS